MGSQWARPFTSTSFCLFLKPLKLRRTEFPSLIWKEYATDARISTLIVHSASAPWSTVHCKLVMDKSFQKIAVWFWQLLQRFLKYISYGLFFTTLFIKLAQGQYYVCFARLWTLLTNLNLACFCPLSTSCRVPTDH